MFNFWKSLSVSLSRPLLLTLHYFFALIFEALFTANISDHRLIVDRLIDRSYFEG